MGECGCGEINNIREIVSIGDYILVVELYTGCRYCHTGIMTSLHLYSQEEASCFQFNPTRVFEPDEYGYSDLHIPIVDQEDLVEAAGSIGNPYEYNDVPEWLSDHGRDLLQKAICFRLAKYESDDN